MAETKTPQEITTAIERAFADRDGLSQSVLELLDAIGYAPNKVTSPRLLISRTLTAARDMRDTVRMLAAHGYSVDRCRLNQIVWELLARPAASTLRPAVSSGPDPSEQLAGSLFALLSHLGYEPEGEATPDELARLVDVAMEETASYKRLESEVRALTAAMEAERNMHTVGAAIHDEERIRQMMREEMDARFQPLTGIPLFEARSEWDAEIRKIVREESGRVVLATMRDLVGDVAVTDDRHWSTVLYDELGKRLPN